jgi:hypothetical protein
LAKRHREILGRLDPIGLNRYQITEEDVQTVEQYLRIIQAGLVGETTWQEMIRYGGAYGTSILIHEIVEIRALKAKGLQPLHQKTRALRQLLAQHIDAHSLALYEEHRYLQEVISRLYGETFEVATLLKANRNDEVDLQLFLESAIGVFLLEEHRLGEAQMQLAKLKGGLTYEN